MGTSQSVVQALETLLKQRDIKVGNRTLKNFVKEVDRVAPWFACSGSLSLASWDKLGKDLDKKLSENDLRIGTKAVWKLVKNCLEDETCEAARVEGQTTLESVQDSMSETERSERMSARALKKKQNTRIKEPPKKSRDKGENRGPTLLVMGQPFLDKKGKTNIYPIRELKALNIQDSSTSEDETLSTEEEVELDEEAARHEEGPPQAPLRVTPTAPPLYESHHRSFSFIPKKVRNKIHQVFPVFDNGDGGRVHAPVEYNQIKELAESVRKYGVTGSFTLMQLDSLRPYHPERARSRLISEAKQGRAWLVLGAQRQKMFEEGRGWFENWFAWSPWLTTLLSSLIGPLVVLFLVVTIGSCLINRMISFIRDRITVMEAIALVNMER